MINWNRVIRSVIQAACGAGIAMLGSITYGCTKETIITAVITFVTTVVVAFLMNIQKQVDDNDADI